MFHYKFKKSQFKYDLKAKLSGTVVGWSTSYYGIYILNFLPTSIHFLIL